MDKFASTLPGLSLPENLRKGQKQTVELALSGESEVRCKLPTGYGKTLTAVCCYAGLRAQGRVNRLLYVVPRSSQATQALEIPKDLQGLGIDTQAIIVTNKDAIIAMKRNRENTNEVFIVTYQALATSRGTLGAVAKLMISNKWMIVVDEYHHVAVDSVWCDRIKSLDCEFLLAMSATPNRLKKGSDYFDDPQVDIKYWQALEEGAVKELHLHTYEYIIDVIDDETKEIKSFTTSELLNECKTTDLDKLDAEMASRKMRWSPKYIDPLISYPAERIADLRPAIRAQMIVQAMSCRHAQMVCEQIKAMLPTLSVDWVGTGDNGRKDEINRKVLQRFCPEKNEHGIRNHTLDVLVQVGMAGEGLDSIDVTEIVILAPANITPSIMQLIGRAARKMKTWNNKQPIAFVNCDTDSALAENGTWKGKNIMGIFDGEILQLEVDEKEQARETEYKELPDLPEIHVSDVRLVSIETDPLYPKLLEEMQPYKGDRTDEQLKEIVTDKYQQLIKERNDKFKSNSTLSQWREAIDLAAGKIAYLVFRRLGESGFRPDRTVIGSYKKKINSKKKRIFGSLETSDIKELELQYKWLKEVEQVILLNHGINGVPQWLR